jgi:hypothetical protein
MFGPERDEVAGGWRTLHYEERRNLYSSPDVTGLTKAKKMRWAGHVAHIWVLRNIRNYDWKA